MTRQQMVYSWGGTSYSKSKVLYPRTVDDIRIGIQSAAVIARGGGFSFGDSALNSDGSVILVNRREDQRTSFNEVTGVLDCATSITQREILELVCPKGWVLPCIPGHSGITLGGMIAADAHGKNHYSSGSIGQHLRSMRILLASGDTVECSRDEYPDLFWATLGGLGLTGIVLEAKLQLKPIQSVYVRSKMVGFVGIDQLLEIFESSKDIYEYILGWASSRKKDSQVWQGAVSLANVLPDESVDRSWSFPKRRSYKIPLLKLVPCSAEITLWAMHQMIKRAYRDGNDSVVNMSHYFFQQELVSNWNEAFRKKGFVDYQCCIPYLSVKDCMTEINRYLHKGNIRTSLIAFKRFGDKTGEGFFSFPLDGVSVTIEAPLTEKLKGQLDEIDEIIVDHGGRINVAKDSRLSSRMLRCMYPHVEKWTQVKRKYDPDNRYMSDLARRLNLV